MYGRGGSLRLRRQQQDEGQEEERRRRRPARRRQGGPLPPRPVAERRVAAGDADGVQPAGAELLVAGGGDEARPGGGARLPVMNSCQKTKRGFSVFVPAAARSKTCLCLWTSCLLLLTDGCRPAWESHILSRSAGVVVGSLCRRRI